MQLQANNKKVAGCQNRQQSWPPWTERQT